LDLSSTRKTPGLSQCRLNQSATACALVLQPSC
jgi:hypothetical protein